METSRRILFSAIFAVVAVVGLIVGVLIGESRSSDDESAPVVSPGEVESPFLSPGETQVQPKTGTDGLITVTEGSILVGDPEADNVVRIYDDFLCPYCRDLVVESSDTIEELASSGDVAFEFIAVDYLGVRSTNHYSARAANASTLVADRYPDAWLSVKTALYASQPSRYDEVTTEDLVSLIENEGVSLTEQDVADLENLSYLSWVYDATAKAAEAQVSGIPAVVVNGEITDILDPQEFIDVVNSLDN